VRGAAEAANFTEAVGRPIKDATEYRQVRRAAAACPFHAIRLRRGAGGLALEAAEGEVNAAYPFPVSTEGDVLLLGFYSPKNAGAFCFCFCFGSDVVCVVSGRLLLSGLREQQSAVGTWLATDQPTHLPTPFPPPPPQKAPPAT
jgi:hypothetical protein